MNELVLELDLVQTIDSKSGIKEYHALSSKRADNWLNTASGYSHLQDWCHLEANYLGGVKVHIEEEWIDKPTGPGFWWVQIYGKISLAHCEPIESFLPVTVIGSDECIAIDNAIFGKWMKLEAPDA